MSKCRIRLGQTILFQNLLHFGHLLFVLAWPGLLLRMVLNELGQVFKVVINGNSLLTRRAVDGMFSSGSLGGLVDTVCTYETFWTIPLKHLQHGSKTLTICATSPIYLCNIHIKQLQHTSETSKTLKTYAYNMRFHRNISLLRLCVTTATASFMCFFLEYPKKFHGSCV